ncbi:uncharacterized protein LOC106057896 isoform X3 [Biomphalaria glabrata]|uniref:Uncharacterized protein LOC106057896 isoform X3 n=1 Tax=Biomphalaria glabrata TaxID=6526 RepID=A0A9W3A5U6_BIOGL|nr:uncharacterized protein LOC106057896 isoform X3 [Biomphalaria glabrata]
MTYPLVSLVSLLTFNVFVPIACQLAHCKLSTSNQVIKARQWPSISKIDKRDFVEYHVTYINDNKENITSLDTANTTRFQPLRWFNINEKIRNILPMIYDYFFTISSSLFDIQTVHIELNATPNDCIRSTDYEEVETITRQYLLKEVLTANSQLCSAHLENSGNTGVISFKTENFDFYPKNMVIGFKRSNDTNNTDIRVPIYGKVNKFKSIMKITDENGVSNIESIKLLLTKRHCVDEIYSAITLFRCIREFITDISSSYCRPSKNLNKCCGCFHGSCLSNECCSVDHPICFPFIRLYFGKFVFGLLFLIVIIPYVVLLNRHYNDFNTLCSAFKTKSLSCPFYAKEPDFFFLFICCAYIFVLLVWFFIPNNDFITMLPLQLPWSKINDKDKFSCSPSIQIFRIILSLVSTAIIYITWGFFLYFCITFFLRVLILSASTRNILDDLALVFFPLFAVVYDYITNVTREFKVISENIFDLVRNDDEFKISRTKDESNEAVPHSNDGQSIKGSLFYIADDLRLQINCPIIFLKKNGKMLISKRIVTQIYNDTSDWVLCELSPYLKAFLMSLVPCAIYTLVFILFVSYTSIFSYSSEVAGYTATALTGLKLVNSKVESLIKEIRFSSESSKEKIKKMLKRERLNFQESWIVTDIVLKTDAQKPPGTIEEEPQIDRNKTEHQVISEISTNPQAPTLDTKI